MMAELFIDLKGATVEANRVDSENADAIALWCGGVAVVEHDALEHSYTYAAVNVPVKNEYGVARAQEGDWVVRAPEGYFYVLRHNTFRQLFSAVK
jgi:hypothetical protein